VAKTSGSWMMERGTVALLGVRVGPPFRLVDLPLGLPTTSARTSRGAWALYPIGPEVVVIHADASGGPSALAQCS
jgi:hypothetical protein